jgi:N-acetylneuraminate synthase
MSTEQEVSETVTVLKSSGAPYVLLHCISTYPAPFRDVNLKYLKRLKTIGDCPIGYSGHERGYYIALAAVARGAKVIEKHFTLDKNMEGNDHKISLLPDEFKAMVEGIRQIEAALLGSGGERVLGQGERMNRENLSKSLMINCALQVGEIITDDMMEVKSPGRGIQPNHRAALVGRKATRAMQPGDFFFATDLEPTHVQARNYTFKRPWGVPVRYHDYEALRRRSNMDFLEFHLSYKDMDHDVSRFFSESYDLGLIVHSPDLFAGDHLLNLAAHDTSYRQRSVRELQRVIDIARTLKPYFKRATRHLIVVSVGGFTQDRPLPLAERAALYERVAQSLSELDADDVEIVPQTLPPFPWYFGGQFFGNLFVDPQDTVSFCQAYGYRVCLDVSHSKLATNHRQTLFSDFVNQVGPFAAHLHIVDAAGVDGEGLQVGEGEIDFATLAAQLDRVAPQASFIPEIWQGHKNGGAGFWIALDRLEKWF